jgi:hypothetical protein
LHENVTPASAETFAQKLRDSLNDPNYGKTAPQPNTPDWKG